MSSSSIPNFDWTLSTVTSAIELMTLTAASRPYRMVENGCLVSFKITTKQDVDDPACISAEGLPEPHLRLFLAKYLVLAWLYVREDSSTLSRFVFSRLTAYLRYYQAILDELRSGNHELFERWWDVESTFEFCQHSSGRVERNGGPQSESLVFEENEIEWGLDEVLNAENLALVTEEKLNQSAGHVKDWIRYELEREGVEDLDLDDELITDSEFNSDITAPTTPRT